MANANVGTSAPVKNFSKMATSLVSKGHYKEKNEGNHPLMRVTKEKVEKLLQDAQKEGNLQFWAVLSVLLRIRFGSFLHQDVGGKKPLNVLRDEMPDDLAFSYLSIFDFLLTPFKKSKRSFKDLFEGERRAKQEVFAHLLEHGFYDQAGISLLAFLRDHQESLPTSLEGNEIEPEQHLSMLLPTLLSAYSGEYGKFVIFKDGVGHNLLSNGRMGLPAELPSRLVCSPEDGKGLVLIGDNDFVAVITESPTKEILEAAAGDNFLSRYREIMGQEVLDEEDQEASSGPAAAPSAEAAIVPVVSQLSVDGQLSTLKTILSKINSEKVRFQSVISSSETKIVELENDLQAEEARHQARLDEIKLSQEETLRERQVAVEMLERLQKDLNDLGFTS